MAALCLVSTGCSLGPAVQPTPEPSVSAPATSTSAACAAAEKMPDLGRDHITSLTHDYPQHPATSGPHYGTWIVPPPQVFANFIPETRLVHNLEHGYVVVYYSVGADSPLPPALVTALAARVAAQRKVLMAPYQLMSPGRALAFAAWDELQLCGPTVTADEAGAALDKFIAAFREGPLAPEAQVP